MGIRHGPEPQSKAIMQALLDPSPTRAEEWSPGDRRAILLHQLGVPLAAEADRLSEVGGLARDEVGRAIRMSGCTSFGDVLQRQPPPEVALRLVKSYAKVALLTGDDLPRDVARVLYVLAILRGRGAGISDISSLDRVSIEREGRRCLTFGWLPDALRRALREGLAGS